MGTLIGTSIGAAATMGRAGKAAEVGVVILVSGVAYATGLLAFSFLAPTLKRIGIWSIPEALHQRYGSGFRVLAAGLLLVVIIGFFGLQLIALVSFSPACSRDSTSATARRSLRPPS
jgi:Na+/proline symporter